MQYFFRIFAENFLAMFISKVYKSNKGTDKKYEYYRLMHSYRVGNKTRHQFIMMLGSLENCPVDKHKVLADRIEQIVIGEKSFFEVEVQIEEIAQNFAKQILEKNITFARKNISRHELSHDDNETDFVTVDINSLETENVREIGAEWLSKQAIEQVRLDVFLKEQHISEQLKKTCQISIISRMVHPASELETERWLHENTGLNQLYELSDSAVSRYALSKSVSYLYENKDIIEKFLYKKVSDLFGLESKIVIYDLTNVFFEGRKKGSKKCKFGRSKEKRKDCKLVCFALLVDKYGFVEYSHFYAGNQSEPATLADVVDDLQKNTSGDRQLPVIVMDAGIATEGNLTDLRKRQYDYICVSRSTLKKFEVIEKDPIIVKDRQGNDIKMQKVIAQNKPDYFVYVKSEQKRAKEESMAEKLTDNFESELADFKANLQKKGAHRNAKTIHERIGRLKERHKIVSGMYEIKYIEDTEKEIVTDIEWTKKVGKKEFDGTYFIRYSNPNLSTPEIWETYNTIREVEETFRCLKTDLQIRPIYHQTDDMILGHIFVGIIGYQLVNAIRYQLQKYDIHLSWKAIVNKMNTYKTLTTEMKTKENAKVVIKYCSRPTPQVKNIYDKLNYKIKPFHKKKIVVT